MKSTSFNFSGESVLVIGGSKGIGRRVSELFVHYKAKNVYSIARSKSNLQKVEDIVCDISDTKHFIKCLDEIKENIDILINVAGTNFCDTIDNIDYDEWDRVIDINLKSFFTSIKYFAPSMIRARKGKIVNVSSIAGRSKSIVSGVHYTASKHGIVGLTKQVAQELGPYGINVNCTCPSQTMTEMLENSMNKKEIIDLADRIPVKRISSVTEQAMPILFLCTDAASYIHGAAIDVNGGQF
jgi:NAD(P)-dependent dehydrogenase (short-subunit alcohol dehydrogenase family)